MPDVLQAVKTACAYIGGPSPGTGYVIAQNRLATCHHVVKDWAQGEQNSIWFGPETGIQNAWVIKVDENTDAAVLAFDGPSPPPLPMAKALQRKAVWEGYGFPRLARASTIGRAQPAPTGLPLDGIVKDPDTSDDSQRPALLLFSDEIAAGNASPLHGFSGTPVVVEGAVVGHLTKYLGDPDDRQRAAYGFVYACPVSAVRALLDIPAVTVDIVVPETTSLSALIPFIPADEYHVFVSYRSTDRPWALSLQARLEGAGYRVFLDQRELKPGDAIVATLQNTLAKSKAGVVLVSKGWLESPWCQEEANVLVGRAVQEPSFHLLPLRLDDSTLPPMLGSRRWLDFNNRPSADGPALQDLLYALVGETPPAVETVPGRIESREGRTVDGVVIQIKAARSTGSEGVLRALNEWKAIGGTDEAPLLVAAETLIQQSRPDLARIELGNRNGIRARQLRALALAKTGATNDAIRMLEQLLEEGNLDSETGGLLAGRYKERFRKGRDISARERSYDLYLDTYNRTGDPFNGINAAAMALQCGDKPTMYRIAGQVRLKLEAKSASDLDHWGRATIGEAYLLEEKMPTARDWYRKAVGAAVGRYENIAVMRRQARMDLEGLKQPANGLDDLFPLPAVVAFVGHMVDADGRPTPRFPKGKVKAVKRAIHERLKALESPQGFCSAARGSDILFIEEILARGGRPTVILPFPEDDFLAVSGGQDWNQRFRDVRDRVELVVLRSTRPSDAELPAAFAETNREIRKRTTEYADRLDERARLLAVWDGRPGDGAGGTADTIEDWHREGTEETMEPDIIDINAL